MITELQRVVYLSHWYSLLVRCSTHVPNIAGSTVNMNMNINRTVWPYELSNFTALRATQFSVDSLVLNEIATCHNENFGPRAQYET